MWSQAGAVARFEPSGARDTGSGQEQQGQELVFIGTALRADALHATLAACLLREGELAPAQNPFPAWDTYGTDDAYEHEHPVAAALLP